jgi:hypothetical protein
VLTLPSATIRDEATPNDWIAAACARSEQQLGEAL